MRLSRTKEWINENGKEVIQENIVAFKHGTLGVLMRPEMYFDDTDIREGLREWIDDPKCQLMDNELRERLRPLLYSKEAESLSEDDFGVFLSKKLLDEG